ncbi:MAG: MFS transporter [Desulfobacterales bacterium]|nr:MFS transporter [Desulfobacterales bacterium]MDJ0886337.1 MFS transporter [Desulfobacterales bacterium]MDJ0991721.1 MFS transporter [Desulfobacterales bacterium]
MTAGPENRNGRARPRRGAMDAATAREVLALPNIRHFIAFRVCFNARFYYPVFAILFLDFGLSLEQFALLNAVWAAAIVLLEVPSGALADIIGRRRLLIGAAALMVAEMALLCLAPRGNPTALFFFFLANRILSGAAEAAASGADEALAYEALKQTGQAEKWGLVLERQIRYQAIGFIVAMTVGAAVYDPDLLNRLLAWCGSPLRIDQAQTLRLPLVLTLVMALATLYQALSMQEFPAPAAEGLAPGDKGPTLGAAFALTFRAGRWILRTRFALTVILAGLLFDHIIRLVITLNSQYLRQIALPEAAFGIIAAGFSLLGVFIPRLARGMAERNRPAFNFGLLVLVTAVGLSGTALFIPFWGLLPLALLYSVMVFNQFFTSHYLNQVAPSAERATVLSFKGLSYNVGYGLVGIAYALVLAYFRGSAGDPAADVEAQVFKLSFGALPWYFLGIAALFSGYAYRHRAAYGLTGKKGSDDDENHAR